MGRKKKDELLLRKAVDRYIGLHDSIGSVKGLFAVMGVEPLFLISCTKTKLDRVSTAMEMYSPSKLFSLSLEVALRVVGEESVYVLSAKHGIIGLDTVIEPYDVTLNRMTADERNAWGRRVVAEAKQLLGKKNITSKEPVFVLMAGKNYYRPFIEDSWLKERSYLFFDPKMKIGKRISYLSKLLG